MIASHQKGGRRMLPTPDYRRMYPALRVRDAKMTITNDE
jgi:hypothetical protein